MIGFAEDALLEKLYTANGLNIVANPHPEGTYISLLRNASKGIAQARGSDYASITSPRHYTYGDSSGIYTGRILLWTDIDLRGRWLDISKEEELSPSLKATISIPPNARPNYRTFNYVFIEKRHHFWFESRNEFNNTIGPTTARRVLSTLIYNANRGEEDPETSVSIIPTENAVSSVLATPSLRTLTIRVNLPNADASSPAARKRVFDRLDAEHATRLDYKLTKSSKAIALTPSADTKELTEVGADTGFARGEGTDSDGHKVVRSTKDMPRTLQLSLDEGASFVRRVLAALNL